MKDGPRKVAGLTVKSHDGGIANGLVWAADHGADVANIIYGVTNSSTISNAAQYMRQKGGLVVAAAGNDGVTLDFSDNLNIIIVSATTNSDNKASWSNYGNSIDVSAPGAGILTTSQGGNYGSWSGTSFASPATAGVVALIMSANSNLSPDEVKNVLEQSAVDLAGNDWHEYYGNGRVDAAAAVALALNTIGNPGDEQAPEVIIFSPTAGQTVNGLALAEVNATDNIGFTEVAFYAGTEYIGSDSTSPYQFSLDSTQFAEGSLNLRAYAYDAAGNEGVSNIVTVDVDNQPEVIDTTAPIVSITNPDDGSTVKRTVKINANATDNVKVESVKLYINGSLKSSINGSSLRYDWNTPQGKQRRAYY